MQSPYLDTSALVKLYVEEDGTDSVFALARDPDSQVVILDVGLVEARSAVRRRQREGDIGQSDADRVLDALERDASSTFLLQPSTSAVVEEACRLVDAYPLRAYDALQLGGCIVFSQGTPGAVVFVCADNRLCDAARGEGIAVLNPVTP